MNAPQDSLSIGAWIALALGAPALAFLALSSRRAAGKLGAIVVKEDPRSAPQFLRWFAVAAALAALLATWPEQGDEAWLWSATLALAAGLLLLSPGPHRQRLGERGVQRGWDARSFDELEEWRVSGDHLRFKVDGEWTAASAPAALHAELREKLRRLRPDHESRFI
jgi:hypothetical protein